MVVRMADHSVWCFVFFFTLFEVLLKTKLSVHGNSHGYMQPNNEVRYLVDGIPVSMHKEFAGVSGIRMPHIEESAMYNIKTHLKFEPPQLDFKERHLGMPHHEKVTLFNVNSNKTIHMSSISGNTVHFHSSFFEDKVIPPLGNTTFNVVFLGREEGEIESNLFIHTSEGSFKYKVKGASVSSPYRLRPLVGVRIPLNSTYSPLIFMHNPHATPMQIVEVYSSGGEFHLELPSGELEGPKHLWEISPFYTKPVIRIRFHARAEKNHTAYVRIKVNKSDEVLVVPLEVEVTSQPGLYALEDIIDFGYGGNLDQPCEMKLLLYNSWNKVMRIQSVSTVPFSKAVKINFQPVKVPPDSNSPAEIATLTFDWRAAFDSKQFTGKIVVKTKQNQQKLVIPYVAQVLEGGFEYNTSVTQYCSDLGHHLVPRNFSLKNKFKIPVAISNISLPSEVEKYFMVQNFSPVIMDPGEMIVLFQLLIKKESLPTNFKLESNLLIHTNVSTLSVPLLCYNGRLTKMIISSFNETELNFGTVGSASRKEAYFALINSNPVPVQLQSWGTNLTGAVVELMGVAVGNISSIKGRHKFNNMNISSVVEPGQYAVFRVLVIAPETEGATLAEIFVQTQFENVVLPARMRVAHGRLEMLPQSLVLDDCFPGKLCVQQLLVRSLFSRPMTVTSITSVPPDPRVSYSYVAKGSQYSGAPLIVPLQTSSVGLLKFDPGLGCGTQCYLGILPNSTAGNQWLQNLGLPTHTKESDLSLFNVRYNRYSSMTRDAAARQNLTLRMDTTEVRDHQFQARVHLTWPKLATNLPSGNRSVLGFPLTQIGNTTYRDLVLQNPSSKALVLQLVMDWTYPQADRLLESLPERFWRKCADCSSLGSKEFVLEDSVWVGSYIRKLFGNSAHANSLPLLLEPGKTAITRLSFSPTKPGLNSAVLIIRNNLTVLEVVKLSGRGAHVHFKFGNRKPGSDAPLLFELADKHLKDCEREKQRKFPVPNLTVKRSFTARNTGELPLYVGGFYVNGLPCEGYGFRILNCVSFQLPPNGTRKIDIAFTPDFTLARIQRTLTIDTSLGFGVNYSVIATLPPFLLASCSIVLGRPSWEPLLYYSAVSFMIFLLFCVLAAAFLESDRILKCAFLAMAKDKAMRSSSDPKPMTPTMQKNGESTKVGCGKADISMDWNPNNASVLTGHDKRSRDVNNSINNSNHHYHKSNGWTPIDEKHSPAEMELKERCSSTKYDESEVVYSSNSTPLMSVKNKKKLAKRNSNNSDNSSLSEHIQETVASKKGWGSLLSRSSNCVSNQTGKAKLNLTENKIASPMRHIQETDCPNKKALEIPKEGKRIIHSSKRNNKHNSEAVVCSEEETSSTTTESSNNEDMDKERDSLNSNMREHKNTPKKDKGKSLDYRDSYEGDCDDDDYEQEGHKKKEFSTRWKSSYKLSLGKQISPITEKPINNEVPKPPSLELPYKLKSSKNTNRERKEKNVLKRRSAEKKDSVTKALTVVNGSNNSLSTSSSRASPPLRTSSCWGENRATFSDVVARNDSPLYSNIVAPRKRSQQSSAPSVFHETGNKKTTDAVNNSTSSSSVLGPIGSKKPLSSTWDNFSEPQQQSLSEFLQQKQDQSSLFLDALTEPSTPGKDVEGVWEERNSIVPLLEDESRKKSEEYQRQHQFRENWPGVDSLWEPLYTPAVDDTLFNPSLREDVSSDTGSVWGSLMGSVWSSSTWSNAPGPVAPPLSPTAVPIVSSTTATENATEEDSVDIDRGLGFDPFSSLNTIWFPANSDTWKASANK
ncbi:transmembrane protein 131 [Anabrus simplex]|uniref:transmembrane protein 131 n=1 Tax=Anabrus simplex TaxID=316456 RepID=UPI0035A2C276